MSTAAKKPVAAPAASVVGVLLALLLIAAGVVLGRDVLITTGAIAGTEWVPSGIDWIDGLTAQQWMLPAGIGAAVVGLLLVVAAVKPRRRTHRPTSIDGVWIRDRDVLRLARLSAADCEGVIDAAATGSARKIKVRATVTSGSDASTVRRAVEESAAAAVAILAKPPRTIAKIKTGAEK